MIRLLQLIFPQLQNLVKMDDDRTDEKYGYYPDQRPLKSLLEYGFVVIDKPPGPTSHEVVAWVKKILEIEKAGHSGTLDPGATGILPLGLGEGTKALSVRLLGPKEYYTLGKATLSHFRRKTYFRSSSNLKGIFIRSLLNVLQ